MSHKRQRVSSQEKEEQRYVEENPDVLKWVEKINPQWNVDSVVVMMGNKQPQALQIMPDVLYVCDKNNVENVFFVLNQNGTCSSSFKVGKLLFKIWGVDPWIKALNDRFVQVMMDNKSVILEEFTNSNKNYIIRVRQESAIKGIFGKGFFCYRNSKKDATNPVSQWLDHPNRRRCHETCYVPIGHVEDNFNFWRGYNVPLASGTNYHIPALILNHFLEVICNNNEEHYAYFVNWLAHLVQRPHIKSQVAVVVSGIKGSGKSLVGKILHGLFGAHAFETSHKHQVLGNNAHLAYKNILIMNEASDKRSISILKGAITESKTNDISNYWNLILFSDHPWCVPATLDERRFFVLQTSSQRVGDFSYFKKLHDQIDDPNGVELSCLLTYLQRVHQLDEDWLPAAHLPRTTTLIEQALQDNDRVDLWWFVECCCKSSSIMKQSEPNYISRSAVFDIYKADQKRYSRLRLYVKITDIIKINHFFYTHLNDPTLFKHDVRRRDSTLPNRPRQYRFASREEIQNYVATYVLKEPNYFLATNDGNDNGDDDDEEEDSEEKSWRTFLDQVNSFNDDEQQKEKEAWHPFSDKINSNNNNNSDDDDDDSADEPRQRYNEEDDDDDDIWS